jgi:predicted TIM-barrel fold metal-dependent hydrolase
MAPLLWRLDRAWRLLGEEVPHVTRPPSELVREHIWVTTQPIEEPPRPHDFEEMLDELEMDDRLLFATDYPHWDFDAPSQALPSSLAVSRRRMIMAENARALYRLPGRA